jgi:hypothetical protein
VALVFSVQAKFSLTDDREPAKNPIYSETRSARCRARAASGNAATVLQRTVMNSRRLIVPPGRTSKWHT